MIHQTRTAFHDAKRQKKAMEVSLDFWLIYYAEPKVPNLIFSFRKYLPDMMNTTGQLQMSPSNMLIIVANIQTMSQFNWKSNHHSMSSKN